MPILVICNPACGDQTGPAFFSEHVFPLLKERDIIPDRVITTESAGQAGSAVIEFLETFEGEVSVILGSGDGTLHEIINSLSLVKLKGVRETTSSLQIRIALVPCGTANALYSSLFRRSAEEGDGVYRLRSLQSFLSNSGTVSLKLAVSTISSSPSALQSRPRVAVSAVVASTALHASILNDSESLRAEVPGIERFKIAARNNIDRWYYSYVKLLPSPRAGVVQIYDPQVRDFVPHEQSSPDDPIVDMGGPFAYFLSTVNVDRLEPAFRIAPLTTDLPSTDASLDLVVVRPQRASSFAMDTPETRKAFSEKSGAVLSAAYQDGAHVNLRYALDDTLTSEGEGPVVVEYIRCGGWEWSPDDIDEKAHLLCADGTIHEIEKGGRVVCTAAVAPDGTGFVIYV